MARKKTCHRAIDIIVRLQHGALGAILLQSLSPFPLRGFAVATCTAQAQARVHKARSAACSAARTVQPMRPRQARPKSKTPDDEQAPPPASDHLGGQRAKEPYQNLKNPLYRVCGNSKAYL